MPTLRAILTRIRGIHGDISPTGPCCLVREKVCELTPRGVMNALGETMVVRHPVDRQVFHSDQIKGVDDAAAVLVGEIAPSPGDALMHPRHHLAPLGTLRRPLLFFAESDAGPWPAPFLQHGRSAGWRSPDLSLRVANVFSPTSMPTCRPVAGKRCWLGAFAGEADIPFASSCYD